MIHEILATEVFDDADSESENWHRAKKIREVLMDYLSSPQLLVVVEHPVPLIGALKL